MPAKVMAGRVDSREEHAFAREGARVNDPWMLCGDGARRCWMENVKRFVVVFARQMSLKESARVALAVGWPS